MDMEFAGEKAMEAQGSGREASILAAGNAAMLMKIGELEIENRELKERKERKALLLERAEYENRRLRRELNEALRSAAKWREQGIRGSEEWAARLEKQIERAIGEILGPKCPRDAQCVSGRGCVECWREHLMLAAERELEAEMRARDQEKAEAEMQARNPEKAETGCGIDGEDCGAREAGQ